MTIRPAFLLFLAALLSCNDGTVPATDLKGAWTSGMAPSGAYTELYLTIAGHTVSGTARWEHGLIDGVPVEYTVVGHQTSGTFTLTLTPDSGSVATFVGKLTTPDKITGTWSEAGFSWTRAFLRFEP